MGKLHLHAGPIGYTVSGSTRRRGEPGAIMLLLAGLLAAVMMAAWAVLPLIAWLLWMPVAGVAAAVRRDGFWGRQWTRPLHLGPWRYYRAHGFHLG